MTLPERLRRCYQVPLLKPHIVRRGFSGGWHWYCFTQDGTHTMFGRGKTPFWAWHAWRYDPLRIQYAEEAEKHKP
jgi:hypothetical protein